MTFSVIRIPFHVILMAFHHSGCILSYCNIVVGPYDFRSYFKIVSDGLKPIFSLTLLIGSYLHESQNIRKLI